MRHSHGALKPKTGQQQNQAWTYIIPRKWHMEKRLADLNWSEAREAVVPSLGNHVVRLVKAWHAMRNRTQEVFGDTSGEQPPGGDENSGNGGVGASSSSSSSSTSLSSESMVAASSSSPQEPTDGDRSSSPGQDPPHRPLFGPLRGVLGIMGVRRSARSWRRCMGLKRAASSAGCSGS